MFLSDADLAGLVAFRRDLHRRPELSGEETATARTVAEALAATGADRILTGLGGHGVAAIYDGVAAGPTVLFRAELDGLPIEEVGDRPHRSQLPCEVRTLLVCHVLAASDMVKVTDVFGAVP